MRHDPGRVLWIGGSPCAGKSTIAATLASKHGFELYRCDEALEAHLQRVEPASQPMMHKLAHTSWNDLWMRPVEVQIREELTFYREEFPMVVGDLLGFPPATAVIAEGTALLPELVAPLLTSPHQGVWIVPTPGFQREHYAQRPWIGDILRQCDDPAQAFDNWMGRDSGFADAIEHSAGQHELHLVRVDGSRSIAEMVAVVAGLFRLPA